MATLDIRKQQEEITEIQWCNNHNLNLRKPCNEQQGIHLPVTTLMDPKNAANLAEAIKAAVQLGWIK